MSTKVYAEPRRVNLHVSNIYKLSRNGVTNRQKKTGSTRSLHVTRNIAIPVSPILKCEDYLGETSAVKMPWPAPRTGAITPFERLAFWNIPSDGRAC